MRTRLLSVCLIVACSSGSFTLDPSASNAVQPGVLPTPHTIFVDAPPAALPRSLSGSANMEARAADFDGDGDTDLLVAREFSTNVLLLNDGHGGFTDASSRLPRDVHDHEDIAVADFDGDGDLDAIVVAEDDRALDYYVNDGDATFSPAPDRLPATRCSANAAAPGDLDGDGDIDVIVGCEGAEIVLLNDGHGRFADESHRLPPGPGRDITQDVVLADLDGDGDLDLIIGNEDGNRLLMNDGHGVFTEAPAGNLPLRAGEETRNVDAGDVDGDGDLDILFANTGWRPGNDPQERLLLNDGRGRFTDATDQLPRDAYTTLDADFADLDGDGDLDIVLVSWQQQPHRVWINDGRGHFQDATSAYLPADAVGPGVEVELVDLDGDRKPEIYITGFRTRDRLFIRGTAAAGVPDGDGTAGTDTTPSGNGSWRSHASLAQPRVEMGAAAIGNVIYVAGGQAPGVPILASAEAFDADANRWSAIAPLPQPRHHHGVASIGGRLYAIGGYTTPQQNAPAATVFVYDPTTNQWSERRPMPAPRAAFATVVLDGRIHAIGGVRGGTALRTHEIYDPATDQWTSAPDMPTAREHVAAAVIDDAIYVVGGRAAQAQGGFAEFNQLEVFRGARWETLPPMPTTRSGLSAGTIGGRLYAIGGEYPGGVFREVEEYSPETGTWRTVAPLPSGRHAFGLAALNHRLFVIGGAGSGHAGSTDSFGFD